MSIFASKTLSVDSVVASFKQTIADLGIVEKESKAEAERQAKIIADAETAKREADVEAARAAAAAEKLNKLFGDL